jgi:hypothetical protein
MGADGFGTRLSKSRRCHHPSPTLPPKPTICGQCGQGHRSFYDQPPRLIGDLPFGDKQRDLLMKLVQAYAERMPPEVAQTEPAEVKAAGLEKMHFAFAQDAAKPGKPFTYHVQGPTFVIEFLNVQSDSAGNPANHIHSCWRNLKGDFGIETR